MPDAPVVPAGEAKPAPNPRDEMVEITQPKAGEAPAAAADDSKAAKPGDGGAGAASPAAERAGEAKPAAGDAKPASGEEAPAAADVEGKKGEPKPADAGKEKPGEAIDVRMREMTKARKDAEQRARDAEERERQAVEALTRLGKEPPKPKPEDGKPAEDPKPVAPEFTDVEQYTKDMSRYAEDLSAWTARKVVTTELAERERKRVEKGQQEANETARTAFQARTKAAAEKMADFDDVCQREDLPITPTMAAAIQADEELGIDVWYHLGKNQAEAERISKLSPGRQLVEIGRISERLAVARAAAPKEQIAEPIKPTGSGPTAVRDPADMDMDEYAAKNKGRAPAASAIH